MSENSYQPYFDDSASQIVDTCPITDFLQLVSFMEFAFLLYFGSGIIDGDLYKMYFFSLSLLKHIPEQILKRSFKYFPLTRGLNIRPQGANDCNSLNKGGIVGPPNDYEKIKEITNNFTNNWDDKIYGKPGMPSGHTTVLTMYFVLHLCNIIYLYISEKKKVNIKSLVLLGIFFIGIILIGYARIYLNCHTFIQVFFGYILGILLGLGSFFLSKLLIKKYPFFKKAFIKFYTEDYIQN